MFHLLLLALGAGFAHTFEGVAALPGLIVSHFHPISHISPPAGVG